jgi:hypothetical protein
MLETCASPLVEGVSGNDPKAERGRGESRHGGAPRGERVMHASHDARRGSHTRLTRALSGATTIEDAPFGAPPTLRFGVSKG